jgi:uncharacterized surface protein with fasciclin (FAS1) repeats
MNEMLILVACIALSACANESSPGGGTPAASATAAAATPPVAAAPATAKSDAKTALDVALASPDHTTLVTAVKAADLVEVLGSPGGVYTVFAPTNEAFDKLPKGTVEALLKPEKQAELRKILQHHVGIPVIATKDMKDGDGIQMADGGKVVVHVKNGKVTVEGANILASIPASNGIVHVVDAVLLPAAK